MKKLILWSPLIVALLWPTLVRAEDDNNSSSSGSGSQRRERFYIGAHAGGQYLDLDALTGGEAFDQLVDDAYSDVVTTGGYDPDAPEPRHYSAENGFVWGIYGGFNLGNYFRLGLRFTHSVLEVRGDGGDSVAFDLDLVTALIEFQLRIPLFRDIFVPFAGISGGYAFLGGDTTVLTSTQPDSDFGISCLDLAGEIGLDINLGRWISLGAVAHFAFIGFYNDGGDDAASAEATWGFATDYLARFTVRI